MSYGYQGKLLEVDLGKNLIKTKELPAQLWRSHLGGSGLAARLLYDEGVYLADPLGEENVLVIMSGMLTGTPVPASCKASFCAKSPLTGLWGEATVGGFWAAELKKTPYDGIIIRGKAEKPVYLVIREGEAQLQDASAIWGMDTYAAAEKIKEAQGKCQVACIGPAGENLVKMACIMVGGVEGRAAGRTGMGAVMGSKNLKGIAVSGSTRPELYDRAGLMEKIKEVLDPIRDNSKGLTNFGTAGGVQGVEANGDLPIRNWSLGSWEEGAAKTCGQYIDKTIFAGHYGCYACPIRCGKDVKIETGPHKGTVASGPEYETIAGFGSNLLNDDVNIIAAANDLCNRLGLDTISASGAIAWAMECYEAGLLTPKDTEEMEITWGNGPVILKLIEAIAYRQGIGELLGEGVKRAAQKLGGMAQEYVVETKGLEYPYHDPRAFTSMAANYATANRGACHLEALGYFAEQGVLPPALLGFNKETTPHGTEGKGELAALLQNFMETFNDLGICKFLMRGKIGPDILAGWVSAATGFDIDGRELMLIGERNFNLKRLFNSKLGVSRKDDYLPLRLSTHDRKTGKAAGSIPHIGKILVDYYQYRGWSPEGVPQDAKLAELGLAEA